MFLAYIDGRPFLFVLGLPLFILLAVIGCRITKARFRKSTVAFVAGIAFTALFAFFLYGPFIGQTETREYMMTWRIEPSPSNGMKEAEVVLSFVDFRGHYIGEYSNELADHLKAKGEKEVKVVFEVTSDYGKIRGFNETEIAGLKTWRSEWGYAGSSGSPEKSPWE